MSQIFALVDCNNFYASCEKLFRPDLKDTPMLVLSNNDGCVVARSKEAKALGIKMGVPVFQIQDAIRYNNIQVFSSNYALYADLSARVMRTLGDMSPRIEVYSIDEAFLDLSDTESVISPEAFGHQIKHRIDNWIGITVCVGLAPTKTLAKLANYGAKKYPATRGVVDLTQRERQLKLMAITPVNEVWGVGRQITKRLNAIGIETALDLAKAPSQMIRSKFSVVLERTHHELNGVSCLELEEIPPKKKQIVCSRSFGSQVTQLDDMREAISQHASRAAEKLRAEEQQAKVMTVFIETNRFKKDQESYSNASVGQLIIPSNDSRDLIELAMQLLKKIWHDGYRYNKGGVMLSDFYDQNAAQQSLFDSEQQSSSSKRLMTALDAINQSGLGKVFIASQGTNNTWAMKRDRLSPAYTTQWNDLPKVR